MATATRKAAAGPHFGANGSTATAWRLGSWGLFVPELLALGGCATVWLVVVQAWLPLAVRLTVGILAGLAILWLGLTMRAPVAICALLVALGWASEDLAFRALLSGFFGLGGLLIVGWRLTHRALVTLDQDGIRFPKPWLTGQARSLAWTELGGVAVVRQIVRRRSPLPWERRRLDYVAFIPAASGPVEQRAHELQSFLLRPIPWGRTKPEIMGWMIHIPRWYARRRLPELLARVRAHRPDVVIIDLRTVPGPAPSHVLPPDDNLLQP
jgi:hypothetical protein